MRVTQEMIDAGYAVLHAKTRDDTWLNSHHHKWRHDLCVAIYAAMAVLQPPVEVEPQPKHLPHDDVRGHTEEEAAPKPAYQTKDRNQATPQAPKATRKTV